MSDPSVVVQGAIFDALTNDMALAALMGGSVRVYDTVEPSAVFPYITIGDDQLIDNGNACFADMFEVFASVHVWSRIVGRIEAKRIAGRARDILIGLSSVPGFKIDGAHAERLDHLRDPDGLTAHSVLTMRYLLAALS